MPWIRYTPLRHAKPMVGAVNNARTEQEHRDAKMRLEGYKKRCEEHGETWPGIELDLSADDQDRPMCCGEYIDWKPGND